ncbi:MAG: hypothetical protein HY210_03600 [Candidatus Omnitrophica bacterium]|nr:hypothetical protein [Candidatus Omnitrophota bacterium]
MKRFAGFILAFTFFLGLPTASRAEHKSVSSGIYRQTFFNDITDTLATIGKSEREKTLIERQRHMARVKARQEKLQKEIHQRIIHR